MGCISGTLKGWREAIAEEMAIGGAPSSHHASDMGDASSLIISKIAYVVSYCIIPASLGQVTCVGVLDKEKRFISQTQRLGNAVTLHVSLVIFT